MIAQECGLEVGEFVWTGGDVHIYSNHLEQVTEQLTRTPHKLPTIKLNPEVKDTFGFRFEDFELVDYTHEAPLYGKVAV